MNARFASHFVSVVIVSLSLAVSSARAAEPAPADAKVHALVVVDSLDEKIGKSVAIDGAKMKENLENGFEGREKRLSLTVLKGEDATPGAVLKYYRSLSIGPSDTVLFYFSGHGAVSRSRGHFLAPRKQVLLRSDVLDAIKETKPRLAICLTDCCAGYYDRSLEVPREAKISWHTLESLFFRHKGIVDVNASSIGELAWCGKEGSLFTLALVEGFGKSPEELGGESKDYVHWDDYFRFARKRTEALFGMLRANEPEIEAENQTPQAFLLPPHRFGVVGKDGKDGVVLARIYRGSPAEAASLRTGDMILKVGDVSVRTREQLERALEKATEGVTFTVRPKGSTEITTLHLRMPE